MEKCARLASVRASRRKNDYVVGRQKIVDVEFSQRAYSALSVLGLTSGSIEVAVELVGLVGLLRWLLAGSPRLCQFIIPCRKPRTCERLLEGDLDAGGSSDESHSLVLWGRDRPKPPNPPKEDELGSSFVP